VKLLLDENLPVKLKFRFKSSFEIYTINDLGWNSIKNGELLKRMRKENFSVLITSDKNLRYQQNLDKHEIVVVLLNGKTNRYKDLVSYVPKIEEVLSPLTSSGIIEID